MGNSIHLERIIMRILRPASNGFNWHWLIVATILCFLTGGLTSVAEAQLAPWNENGLTMGHVHLRAKDAEGMRRFFVSLGGSPSPIRPEMIVFPGLLS